MKLKTIKEKFIEEYKENGWFIATDDQEPILDFIISELQARDKEWIEAIGEDIDWGEATPYEDILKIELINNFKSKIRQKMGVKK